MLLNLLKPCLGFRAHLAHPSCRSVLQFGMIFVFPRSPGGAQSITLPATLDFVAGDLGQECTSATFADEFVDVGDQINREYDMRSSAHTHSVT